MTPRATVLIPTFDHGPLLRLALESARRQTESRIEILVVGDGAPPIAEQIAREAATHDPRVRYFPFPKDASKGETHRHTVLREARGAIVCYLADDDLWMPDHIATMLGLLRPDGGADLATTLMLRVAPQGRLTLGPTRFVDLSRPLDRQLFAQPTSGFAIGLSVVAHTRALYDRLPSGWGPTPPGTPTDGWMWRRLMHVPGVRPVSTCHATVLQFHSPPRRQWSLERRLEEMTGWAGELDAGRLDAAARRLERRALRRSPFRSAWKRLWTQFHRHPPLGRRVMRLAATVLNRPRG